MTLNFGQRAMKIENKPIVNKKVDYRVLSIQLQSELDEKNDIITSLEIKVSELEDKVKSLQDENDELKLYKEVEETSASTQEEAKEDPKVDMAEVEAMSQDLLKKKEEEFQAKRKEDLKRFKKMHAEVMLKKEKEYKAILEDADKLIFEQEKEIESLQLKLKNADAEINEVEENCKELEKEKEELNSRIIEINQDNEDLRNVISIEREKMEAEKKEIAKKVAKAHQEHEIKLKKLKKKFILETSNKIKEIDREWNLKWEKKKNELELLSIKKEIEEFFMKLGLEEDIEFKSEIKNS
jgi:DNA repair exonuclease SbcCD ATPase subunit